MNIQAPEPILSSKHKAVIQRETIGSAIANGLFAALFVWLLVPKEGKAMTGEQGLDIDIAVTTFLTIWLMSLVMTPLIGRQIRLDQAPQLNLAWSQHPILRYLPPKTGWRSAMLALIGAILLSPPLIAIVYGLGIDPWSFQLVLTAKIGYGIFLGLVFGPVITLAAMVRPPLVDQ